MHFEKWEGLGNDFVLMDVEQLTGRHDTDPSRSALARRLCDRRFGVGADGLLLVGQPEASEPSMVVYNADGSRPQMCGNGLRCVASFVASRPGRSQGSLTVRTDAGLRSCEVKRVSDHPFGVTVDMGRAELGETFTLEHGGRSFDFVRVNVGNPHAVTFQAGSEALLDEVGARVDGLDEEGCNTELCVATADGCRLDVMVFERGVGRTLACGTGASAAAAAAVAAGLAPEDRPIEVQLPGGALQLVIRPTAEARAYRVELSGPARRVFTGAYPGGG